MVYAEPRGFRGYLRVVGIWPPQARQTHGHHVAACIGIQALQAMEELTEPQTRGSELLGQVPQAHY